MTKRFENRIDPVIKRVLKLIYPRSKFAQSSDRPAHTLWTTTNY